MARSMNRSPCRHRKSPEWAVLLNVGAMRDEALAALRWGGQLNRKRNLTLVAQNTELNGPVLILALGGEFLAKLPDGADALAVHRGDDIARLHPVLFRGRTGVDVAN